MSVKQEYEVLARIDNYKSNLKMAEKTGMGGVSRSIRAKLAELNWVLGKGE